MPKHLGESVGRDGAGARKVFPWGLAVAGSAAMLAFSGVLAPAARAADSRPTAVVSLGDSFISGEGGRWQGNGAPWIPGGDVYGTDRAAYDCHWNYWTCDRDPKRVYGDSYESGCNRSDVAEIQSAPIAVDRRLNLACSGAITTDVLRRADGGQSQKGQAPQADQLTALARNNAVKLVVLSIGGNDLGFSDVLKQCAYRFLENRAACQQSEEPVIASKLTSTGPRVQAVLASIRAAMTSAGYSNNDYRLVLQSYPAPLPAGSKYRYGETYTRYTTGGCPFYNSDSDWAHNSVGPRIAAMLQAAAAAQGAEFLDLQGAFSGHEVCSVDDHQANAANNLDHPVSTTYGEWIRFATKFTQGQDQESLHPNAYGQLALGDCLGKLYQQTPGNYRCTNTLGRSPETMTLTALR